jgi:hypothetical protein
LLSLCISVYYNLNTLTGQSALAQKKYEPAYLADCFVEEEPGCCLTLAGLQTCSFEWSLKSILFQPIPSGLRSK